MKLLSVALTILCFGAATYMFIGNIHHHWYSIELMIQAYLIPTGVIMLGFFWLGRTFNSP